MTIEAENPPAADLAGHAWTVSAKQATMQVEIQAIPPSIQGIDFCIQRSRITDISASFEEDVRSNTRQLDPVVAAIVKQLTPNFYVKRQGDWETHEFATMRPKEELGNEPA